LKLLYLNGQRKRTNQPSSTYSKQTQGSKTKKGNNLTKEETIRKLKFNIELLSEAIEYWSREGIDKDRWEDTDSKSQRALKEI